MPSNFEDKLREADESFVISPSSGAWMRMQQKMRTQRKFYWIWLLPFILAISGITIWLMQNTEKTDSKRLVGHSEQSIKGQLNKEQTISEQIPNSTKQVITVGEPIVKTVKPAIPVIQLNTPPKFTFLNYKRSSEFPLISFDEPIENKFSKWQLLPKFFGFNFISNSIEMNRINIIFPFAEPLKDNEKADYVPGHWELGLVFNAGRSGLNDMSKSESALTAKALAVLDENPKTQSINVFGVDMCLSYFFKKQFFIRSGIGYQQTGVKYEVAPAANPVNNQPLWKRNTNSPGYVWYNNQVNYLEIPLLGGIQLQRRVFNYQIITGLAFRYAVSGNFLQRYNETNNPDLHDFWLPDAGAMNREQFVWTSKLDIGYSLNKASGIKLESGYSRHISNLLNYSGKKLWNMNIGLGYTFKF